MEEKGKEELTEKSSPPKVLLDNEVGESFLEQHLTQPQHLVSSNKQAMAFIRDGGCVIDNVILRDRKLNAGELVILDTDDYGIHSAEVVEVLPQKDYYNNKACSVKIKKRET